MRMENSNNNTKKLELETRISFRLHVIYVVFITMIPVQ